MFRERVYVLGAGERAQGRSWNALRTRKDAGMHVVGWDGVVGRQEGAKRGVQLCPGGVSRPKRVSTAVIVALEDRRRRISCE